MSVFVDDPPEWFKELPPFPEEWGWCRGRMLPQEPEGLYQVVLHQDLDQTFSHSSVRTEHIRWFFDRGVYAIAQPRKIEAGIKRTIYGLALFRLKTIRAVTDFVYHVTPTDKVARIQRGGLLTGRRAGECTSSWQEAIDFVHVWSTSEQAVAWPQNRKLRAAHSGPWSMVKLVPQSPLYQDPKSENGGWIFGCDYCVPNACIADVFDMNS